MKSENARLLNAIDKKGGEAAKELRKLVPPTTLGRHLDGVTPTGEWMERYELALGLRASGWLAPKQLKKELKRTRALARAHVSSARSYLTPEQRDAEAMHQRFMEDRDQ